MSITKTEDRLIELLVSLEASKETTLAVTDFLTTDELRQQMIDLMIDRYEDKGKVTEQDMLKAMIILTQEKKPTFTNQEK